MSSATEPDAVEERPERPLDEFVEEGRCQAIAEYSGERCRRDALVGADYCPDHFPSGE